MWGYLVKKKVEKKFGVTLRHGALYPLLNKLEINGYLRSRKQQHGGRIRKIYEITSKGIQVIDAYNEFLKEQIQMRDIKE
jgi:DNA-binding PadR family transcriptional regulator